MSTEELSQAIERDRKERTENCLKDIQNVLSNYRCTLDITFVCRMSSKNHEFIVDVIPLELLKQ